MEDWMRRAFMVPTEDADRQVWYIVEGPAEGVQAMTTYLLQTQDDYACGRQVPLRHDMAGLVLFAHFDADDSSSLARPLPLLLDQFRDLMAEHGLRVWTMDTYHTALRDLRVNAVTVLV